MKRILPKTVLTAISFVIVCSMLAVQTFAVQAYSVPNNYNGKLFRDEGSMRFFTPIKGSVSQVLEIVGVTVTPHVRSGNIAYEISDSNSTNMNLGALLNIYVHNKTDKPVYPQITFAGKTASEYLKTHPQQICWASTPDTRTDRYFDCEGPQADSFTDFTPLTEFIPAGGIDCYSINVTDGNLLYDGLKMDISVDSATGTALLYGDRQFVDIKRIQWSSSANTAFYPDGFSVCIQNDSANDTTVNYIGICQGTDEYYLHYWSDTERLDFSGESVISAGQTSFVSVALNEPADFCEYLVEINVTNNGKTYSIFEKSRPLVNDFDISVGWAGGDLEKESFIKAISSMHFNTVIGAYGSDYYLKSEEFREQYPIKIFGYNEDGAYSDDMTVENGVVTVYDIDDVHASLPFGEPQLNDGEGDQQPMRVYNRLITYRNAPYPTNITLSHEPAFYRYTGLSDMCHYDAYRIVAPFSDAWYLYLNYAQEDKYAIYWGAPLETQGDYMRTLAQLNCPNNVAAWTQGANTWDVFPRFTSDSKYMFSPNPYELRIQAYENIANGANSLYWFNINGGDLLYYTESAPEMLRVNRELFTARELLKQQIPYYYVNSNGFDLNVNITPDTALLFVTDLNYSISDDMYKYSGSRNNQSFSFELPEYLTNKTHLVKIADSGVELIDGFTVSDNTVSFTDTVDMTAMYAFTDLAGYEELKNSYLCALDAESFNIYENGEYYDELQEEYGYSDDNPYVPEAAEKLREPDRFALYAFLAVLIIPLENIITSIIPVLLSQLGLA